METALGRAVKETTDKVQAEAKTREEFLKKSFEGERNVLAAKIESFESVIKEQKEQINKLSQQLEKAYQKVEDIAVKSVGGISDLKTLAAHVSWQSESFKKQSQEK
jgi:oligoribonuclease NrnB/cAMP/cGMP phosphodiesterase (DHH superfamily)